MRVLLLVLLLLCPVTYALAETPPPPPVPAGFTPPGMGLTPAKTMDAFVNLAYREDGTLDEKGRWTLFADPSATFQTPGLNCSGFVVEGSRYLLGKNFTPSAAMRDRAGDSGPGAAKGQDWDFGWDVVCNISEGFKRALLLPGGKTADPAGYDGTYRGWELNSDATWDELLPRFKPGRLYLISFSKGTKQPGYTMLHYHVGIIVKGDKGETFLYQTSSDAGKANRRDLAAPKGMASLHRDFADKPGNKKMIVVLEVEIPERD